MPSVELKQRKSTSFASFRIQNTPQLECHISANPLDRIDWYRNGQLLAQPTRQQHDTNDETNEIKNNELDYKLETQDVSDLDQPFSLLATLTITV